MAEEQKKPVRRPAVSKPAAKSAASKPVSAQSPEAIKSIEIKENLYFRYIGK